MFLPLLALIVMTLLFLVVVSGNDVVVGVDFDVCVDDGVVDVLVDGVGVGVKMNVDVMAVYCDVFGVVVDVEGGVDDAIVVVPFC